MSKGQAKAFVQKLDPFYPVLDSSEWLSRLLPLGIKLVQLRVKDLPEEELRKEIILAKKLSDDARCQLVVNDYWELAIELGCDYVHLGQEDLEDANIPALKSAGIKIGVSTHSTQELNTALSLEPDYIALGPVYPTRLKKMPWAPQGLTQVETWKRQIGTLPLIAIGGMNLQRAKGVFDAGADVIAMVTDITLHPDPEAQVLRWIGVTEHYRPLTFE